MRRKRGEGKLLSTERIFAAGMWTNVPLRLVTDRRGIRPEFTYVMRLDEPNFEVRHKDPEECMKLARTELERLLSVQWQDILIVHVSSDECEHIIHGRRATDSAELELLVREAQIGYRPDGKMVHRYGGHERIDQGSPCRDNESMIPDTPHNRERVLSILAGLRTLAHKVQDLLGQHNITHTLANLKMLELPAPAATPKRRKKA